MKLTLKLAKETVKASHPRACCRYGWNTLSGKLVDYYEIYPNLTTSGHFVGNSYRSPVRLGTASTAGGAWKDAAAKIIERCDTERAGKP